MLNLLPLLLHVQLESLGAEVECLKKDKEHLRINLHRAEEEVSKLDLIKFVPLSPSLYVRVSNLVVYVC